MSVAIWMMAAYMDSIPVSLEQAAWIDGASIFRGFYRMVLRNSLPGILSTAIFTYLACLERLPGGPGVHQDRDKYTLPLGRGVVLPAERDRLGGLVMAQSRWS